MSTRIDRHTKRRLATRQRISDIATALFAEHGFDKVTIDAIAEAADVGRMTVFNHFARKEDLFFDREAVIRDTLSAAILAPSPLHPVERLRALAHDLVAQDAPFLRFAPQAQGFIDTLLASETLKSRARALRDEVTADIRRDLTRALEATPQKPVRSEDLSESGLTLDAALSLCASVLVASWVTAFTEAQRHFGATGNSASARSLFLCLVDKGSTAALGILQV
ncbi:TetR/AcrR family transcriptional regulator [Asaia krungthepensis]|uniref:TetR family transcriptional regulator n=1 Tax=Asaia krungthepensis NRIC 0535 TaxID=1307925 RepID=A0ABQ0Q005_9PROT|nr:TetR/AcrR family transcriptional regulator [Asaia krungthepensis]GBQ85782.1 TetR family transcriptional regulator [Asaia krungthepensis NRIC 0535]